MRLKLTLIALLSVAVLHAQPVLPSSSQVEAFYHSKTMIVLEPELFSPYNIFIKEVVKEHWNITPYEVINYENFEKLRKDSSYSFLTVTQTRYDRDKSKIVYNYLDLMLGADVSTLTEMPLLGSLPLSYPDADADEENYSSKLGVMIRFLQNRVGSLKNQPGISGMRYLRYYNKNIPEIKDHVLLLARDDLSPGLLEEGILHKYYRYPFKIVTRVELDSIIEEGTEDVAFLHVVGPGARQREGWSIKLIFGLKDAKLCYYNKHVISDKKPNGFLLSDLKKTGR